MGKDGQTPLMAGRRRGIAITDLQASAAIAEASNQMCWPQPSRWPPYPGMGYDRGPAGRRWRSWWSAPAQMGVRERVLTSRRLLTLWLPLLGLSISVPNTDRVSA